MFTLFENLHREEKEIKKFSSLLETTLRLNEKQSNGDRDSPESVTEEEEAKDHKVINNEFQIAPAAPRAPKGIGKLLKRLLSINLGAGGS